MNNFYFLNAADSIIAYLKRALIVLPVVIGIGATIPAQAQAQRSAPASVAVAAPAPTKPRVQIADSIVAVVNSDAITRKELDERIAVMTAQLKSQNIALPPPDILQKQVLEQMILTRAQLQLAKDKGLSIDDATLDRTMLRIAEQNHMTLQALRNQIEKEGTNFAAFREEIRDEVTMQRLREIEVISKIQVNDSEVDNFIAAQAADKSAQQEYNLSHILVAIPQNASAEQIAERRNRADDIVRQLRTGADFAKLAATYSDASDALKGGDLGWRGRSQLPPLFLEAVAPLTKGEVTDPIRSSNGFHILKLSGKRAPSIMTTAAAVPEVQQTHARHILIKTNQVVSVDDARRKLLEIKARIDNGEATFEEMAKQYSNDLSASSGGDLGWLYPGDTVPDFERAMDALQPGQISGPVESPFGVHLIQVIERKTDDVSKERQRAAARTALRERKTDEATQDWLRQLRDSAYVEYRLDDK